MHQPLECIRTTVSRHLPHALFIYLPRVANSIADDLAGQATQLPWRDTEVIPPISTGTQDRYPSDRPFRRLSSKQEGFTSNA
jgi:hypothetical protein